MRARLINNSTLTYMDSGSRPRSTFKESLRMICSNCDKGILLVLSPVVRRYFKNISCPRCNGSGIAPSYDGEEINKLDPIIGDEASTKGGRNLDATERVEN